MPQVGKKKFSYTKAGKKKAKAYAKKTGTLFIILSSRVLGETNIIRSITTGIITSGLIWYLVDEVLGIYLVAMPAIFGGSS